MANSMEYPKYVLKRKKLNKKRTAIVFRRNYLSVDDFLPTDTGWRLEESFIHYETKCTLIIEANIPDLSQLFAVNSKSLKIKGNKNSFGLYVSFNDRKMPFSVDLKHEELQIHLECSGKHLAYDDGTGIKNTRAKQAEKKLYANWKQKKSNATAPYVGSGYAVTHPYQGGGVSHK